MNANFSHKLLWFGIGIKFINGTLELFGAFLLAIISSKTLHYLVTTVLAPELIEDSHYFIAATLSHALANYSLSMKIFLISYLTIHGLFKVGLVISLWEKKIWAYPLGISLLCAFALYQLFLVATHHSLWLLLFATIDIVIALLLWLEYRGLKCAKRLAKKP